ncbi:MAG: NAD(P)-dependent oxidoreductase [Sphingomonadales bacterium]
MQERLVIFVDSVHPILEERLTQAGFVCQRHFKTSIEELRKILPQVYGLVIRSRFTIDESFLANCAQLKFIARSGSGLENIDQQACQKRQIVLYNSPEGNRNAVAEHALGMLLNLLNKLNKADKEVRSGIWNREQNRGEELDGKTVGIIGYGNNGAAFAKKLRGFDVKVLAHDKYKTGFGDHFVQECTLEAIHQQADVISFHIPQNKETKYFFNEDFLSQMQRPFYLLNLSRGKIVNTAALVKGLDNGQIKGAGLDVLEYEQKSFESFFDQELPTAFQSLIQRDNICFSPHVGGWTSESYVKLSSVLADKILADENA